MKIILYRPEIPQNTGNIVRTCSATGTDLVLVRPLGFSTSNRKLKRAGLDYWGNTNILEIDDLISYLDSVSEQFYFFSSKATTNYSEVTYNPNTLLIFGSETQGLPTLFWQKWNEKFVRIPVREGARCLNLSNAAAIAIYEAIRQQNFSLLK